MKKLLAVVLIELHGSLLASTVVKYHALDYQREVTFGRGACAGLAQALLFVLHTCLGLKIKENYDNALFLFM
jgi:hypothetical protein